MFNQTSALEALRLQLMKTTTRLHSMRTYNGQRSQLPVCALNYLHHVRNRSFQNGGHGEGVFLG